jgi:hypothetical protein
MKISATSSRSLWQILRFQDSKSRKFPNTSKQSEQLLTFKYEFFPLRLKFQIIFSIKSVFVSHTDWVFEAYKMVGSKTYIHLYWIDKISIYCSSLMIFNYFTLLYCYKNSKIINFKISFKDSFFSVFPRPMCYLHL